MAKKGKGKAPKGRAKQKQKAQKGGNWAPENKHLSKRILLDDDDDWGV